MTQDNRDQMSSDKAELSKLILQEETFWKQRSKDLWLNEGDRNSSFFHAKASRRHQMNSIRKLRNPDGSSTETAEGVQRCILEYFQGVFTSCRPRLDDIQSGTEFLPTVVNAEMVEDLLRPYTETEVTKALFGMSPLKSPGPDWRLITDNVLLAFETNHFLNTHSRGRKHFMNLKLDISKAYDRVEWSFLKRVLGKLGFPSAFIDLIMLCISVSYSFVLKSLSALFREAADRGSVRGWRFAPELPVSPIYSLLMIPWSFPQLTFPRRNTPIDIQRGLAEALGLRLENKHEVYLGLPAVAFRSKRALFAALKDRIWKRIQGWHEKTLSQAGKAVLIQAVVQAIPSYTMSCFKLPRTLLQEFQALAANFFWHDGDRRRIHWLAWDKMCKKLEGGLGFRNLEAFNLALLAKQLWRLLSRPESLVCRVLKEKYFPHTHLFDAQLGTRPSFTWRSIMAAMHLFRSGCRWRIGTGHSVNIWTDPWLPRTPSFRVITPRPSHIHVLWVHELISEDLHDWNVELIRAMFWPRTGTLSSKSLLASSAQWICLCGTTQRMVYFRSVVPTTSLCLCPLKLALVGHVGLRSYGTKYGKLLRRTR
ncbi:UNVERIFIED_CONTAM: putative mitochondrial protein [Sesamum calycinum]|uniref:Mitochondrial protein n=1 Tax=Sesamum calycinum TaxID=2727403 RepID=A0AAW2T1M6_9LAMI